MIRTLVIITLTPLALFIGLAGCVNMVAYHAHAASSGAAQVCDKSGKPIAYAACETVKQCEALSRQCKPPSKERHA